MSTVPQTRLQQVVYWFKNSAIMIALGKRLNPARELEMRWILDGLRTMNPGRILDVGCGDGFWSAHVARKSGAAVVGIDPFEVDINVARKRHVGRASFVLGAAESLPFGDGEFDAVVSVCVFEHLQDDRKALEEVRRVLRPGGVFVATVDSLDAPSIRAEYRAWHNSAFRCARLYPAGTFGSLAAGSGFLLVRGRPLLGSRFGVWWEMFSEQHRVLKHFLMPFIFLPILFAERREYGHGYKYGIVAQKK